MLSLEMRSFTGGFFEADFIDRPPIQHGSSFKKWSENPNFNNDN